MTEFKVNEYLSIKLEDEKTNIYVNNELFTLCKHLKLKTVKSDSVSISPETEFWGYCSALQAWAENDYSLDLIDKHFAFILLKKLRKASDLKAMKALSSLTNCMYCRQVLSQDDVYCPNCRKLVLNPDNPRRVGSLNLIDAEVENFTDAQHEEAIERYKLVLEEDSQNVQALYYLGMSYYHLKKFRNAISCLRRAIAIDPSNELRYYKNIVASFIQMHKYQKALLLCEGLIEENPKSAEYHALSGHVHVCLGDYNKAITLYHKSIEDSYEPILNPYFGLGKIYFLKYEFSIALNVIRRQLEIWGNDRLFLLRWQIEIEKGEYDNLIPILRKAFQQHLVLKKQLDSYSKSINTLLGRIYLNKGQYAKAIKCFKGGIYPFHLSVVYTIRRKYKKAIRICEKAIKVNKRNENAWAYLGTIYAKTQNFDKAKKAINIARALNPYSDNVKLNLAYIYIKHELLDEAIIICNEILKKSPKHAVGLLYKGYAYFDKGDFEFALEVINKVLETNPNSDSAKLYLAKIYFQQKSYNKALEVIKTRLNPYSRDFFDLAVDILAIINQ